MKKFIFLLILILGIFAATTALAIKPPNYRKIPYSKSSENITLKCDAPCKFLSRNLEKAFTRLNKDFKKYEAYTGVPIPESLKPVEVHLYFRDKACESKVKYSGTMAFATKRGEKALICLNNPLEDTLTGQGAFVHELTHLYFYPSPDAPVEENIAGAMNGKMMGLAKSTLCDDSYGDPIAPVIQGFCKTYGFDWDKMPALIKKLAEMRQQGTYITGEVIEQAVKDLTKPGK
ncbi:MAG: hypothetical protein AAB588_05900 [Patescibacteria group bacterium]